MKTVWYGVRSVIYDGPMCEDEMRIIWDVREEKPENEVQHRERFDVYDDWFDSLEECKQFLKDGKESGCKLMNFSLEEV